MVHFPQITTIDEKKIAEFQEFLCTPFWLNILKIVCVCVKVFSVHVNNQFTCNLYCFFCTTVFGMLICPSIKFIAMRIKESCKSRKITLCMPICSFECDEKRLFNFYAIFATAVIRSIQISILSLVKKIMQIAGITCPCKWKHVFPRALIHNKF